MSDEDEIDIPEDESADLADGGAEFSDEELSSDLELGEQSQSSISRAQQTASNINAGAGEDTGTQANMLDFDDSMDSDLGLEEKTPEEAELSDRERLIQEARMRKQQRENGEIVDGEDEDDDAEEFGAEEDEDKYPKRYGKYLVLDHLIDGGMAKICIARYLGEEANKMVAIKMVQKKFSQDKDLKQMFIDELKVSFGLQHPNIAATFDYGTINEQLYVSMEFIHGRDLDQVTKRLNEQGKKWSIPAACYCISKAAEALHYAHTFKDNLSGECLNIVHRDISPHNIMLTYDGNPKLIDFGIAATNNEEKEGEEEDEKEEEAIKGKVSYMAPEILEGKELDGRYDLFAIGLSLYEMLVGERVFLGETDIDTLRQIMLCQVERPSNKRDDIPEYLDEIILKCLERDPVNRYANLEKFNRDLTKFLFKEYPDFNAADVGPFISEIFAEEIAKDREKFLEYGKIDMAAVVKEIEEEEARKKEIAEGGGGDKTRRMKIMNFDFAEVNSAIDGGIEELQLDFDAKLSRAELAKKNREAQQANMMKMIEKRSGGGGNQTSIFSLLDIDESDLNKKEEKKKKKREPMAKETKQILASLLAVAGIAALIFTGKLDFVPQKLMKLVDSLPFMKEEVPAPKQVETAPPPVPEPAPVVVKEPEPAPAPQPVEKVVQEKAVATKTDKEETITKVFKTMEETVDQIAKEVKEKGTDADLTKVGTVLKQGVSEVSREVQKGVDQEMKVVTKKIEEIKENHTKNTRKTPEQIKAELAAKFKALEEADKKGKPANVQVVPKTATSPSPSAPTVVKKTFPTTERKPAALDPDAELKKKMAEKFKSIDQEDRENPNDADKIKEEKSTLGRVKTFIKTRKVYKKVIQFFE